MQPLAQPQVDEILATNRAQGQVRLAVDSTAHRTRRKRVHESGSLRVRFPSTTTNELEAVLVNTAGGMTGGDVFDIDVAVGAQAQLVMTTAAAEKVYRSLGAPAAINVKMTVAEGASLAWLPQETILFNNARLSRTIEVELTEGAQLLLVEPLVFGRIGMGETVTSGALHERWRVRRDGRLIYADGLRLDGAIADRLAKRATAGGGEAIATLLVVPGDDAMVQQVRALAEGLRGDIGVSAWNGLALVRLCASDGATLRHNVTCLLAALRATALPRLWVN